MIAWLPQQGKLAVLSVSGAGPGTDLKDQLGLDFSSILRVSMEVLGKFPIEKWGYSIQLC